MFTRLEVIVLTNTQTNKHTLPKTSNVLRYATALGNQSNTALNNRLFLEPSTMQKLTDIGSGLCSIRVHVALINIITTSLIIITIVIIIVVFSFVVVIVIVVVIIGAWELTPGSRTVA